MESSIQPEPEDQHASTKPIRSRRSSRRIATSPALSSEVSDFVEVLSADSATELLNAEEPRDDVALSGYTRFTEANEAEGKRQYQQSLDLFDQGAAIVDLKANLVLKKSSGSIRSTSALTLLQRKLFNALLFIARPSLSTQTSFKVPVDYLSWCVNHDRVDSSYLKESLTEMKKVVIEVARGEKWALVSLLGTVVFEGRDLYYEVPKAIQHIFNAPKKYYYISMAVNARFRSKYALALYELIKENEYRGATDIMSVDEFRDRMGIDKEEYKEFKRLSARTITAPLQELEELSDYTAEVEYKSRGRKIIGIQFKNIRPNNKNKLDAENSERIKPEYWTMMRDDFGLSRSQIEQISSNYPSAKVEEICDVLYYRYICKDREIKNGHRLLNTAFQDTDDKYHLTNREKNELAVVKERKKKKSLEEQQEETLRQEYATRKLRLVEMWGNLTDEEQNRHWHAFGLAEESKGIIATGHYKFGVYNLEHPAVNNAFMNYALRMGLLEI